MRLDELEWKHPEDSDYPRAHLLRAKHRIEVWAEPDYSSYDVYVYTPNGKVGEEIFTEIFTRIGLDTLATQCILLDLLQRYPEK